MDSFLRFGTEFAYNTVMELIRTYKYRLYPNKSQSYLLDEMLVQHRYAYSGIIVKKGLSVKKHKCSHCGYIQDRDVNAAINIKNLAFG